jgi:hypothetical protein
MRFSIWPRFDAAAVWTSALVPLHAHGLDHRQRGQRVDEGRSAVGRCCVGGKHEAVLGPHAAVLGIHGAADNGDSLAVQRLRLPRVAGCDDDSGALVANGHGLIEPARNRLHQALRNLRFHQRQPVLDRRDGAGEVRGSEEEAEVARIDRRRLNAHDDLVGLGRQHWRIDQ